MIITRPLHDRYTTVTRPCRLESLETRLLGAEVAHWRLTISGTMPELQYQRQPTTTREFGGSRLLPSLR